MVWAAWQPNGQGRSSKSNSHRVHNCTPSVLRIERGKKKRKIKKKETTKPDRHPTKPLKEINTNSQQKYRKTHKVKGPHPTLSFAPSLSRGKNVFEREFSHRFDCSGLG
jgi:hypothetical protein